MSIMDNLILILKKFVQYDLGLVKTRGKMGQCSTCLVSGKCFAPHEQGVNDRRHCAGVVCTVQHLF